MLHRRPIAIAALLLATTGSVSACGFDYPTDRVNTIAAGVTDRSGDMDALGIRILSSEAGSGRLIGSLANNSDEAASLDSVVGESVTAEAFEPVEVEALGGLNLAAAETTPIPLAGEFEAGDVVPLELGFSNGETVLLDVPVVKNCFQYTAVPTPSAATSEATPPVEGEDSTETGESSESAVEETEHTDEHAEGGSQVYACEQELEVEGH